MTPLISLILVFIIQIIGYIFFYRKGIKGWRYALFVVLLLLCILILPGAFISAYFNNDELNNPRCGMVDLGMYMFFWMFGVGGLLLIHLLFWGVNKLKGRK